MSVSFPAAAAVVESRWTAFKTSCNVKVLSMQYDDDGTGYTIYAVDGTVVYKTYIWQGTMPSTDPNYSQSQNDTDKSDFETNYKAYCNQQVDDNELDPRLIHRFGNLTTTAVTEVLMANQTYAEPASQAQRSVVSTSTQDKSGGTGAFTVRLTYLDSNYNLATEDIVMNGTTPVNTVGTTIRFIEKFQVIQGAAAAGKISLMSTTAGGGTQVAAIGAGTEDAFLCHHYVPAGKRCYILGWGATVSGNANFKLKGQQRFSGNLVDQNLDLEDLFMGTSTSPSGRTEFYRTFPSPLPVGEKCYVRVTVVPGQTSSTIERATLDVWEDKS